MYKIMLPKYNQKKTIMIIAGEASGDHHGAKLVNAMKMEKNNLSCALLYQPADLGMETGTCKKNREDNRSYGRYPSI